MIQVILDDKSEAEFRKAASKQFGLKHGFVKKAAQEALIEWTKKHSESWVA